MSGAANITVRVPLAIRRRPGRKTVVTPTGETAAVIQTRADPALLKALARAFRWQRLLDEGRYGSITELAAAEKIERGYLGKMLQLTLLPPATVEAIVDGRQRPEVSLLGLMEGVGMLWQKYVECRSALDPMSDRHHSHSTTGGRQRLARACLNAKSQPAATLRSELLTPKHKAKTAIDVRTSELS